MNEKKKRYAEGHLKVSQVDSSRKAIAALLTKYRSAHAPVAHIVHEVSAGAPIFTPRTSLAREFRELVPPADSATEKTIGKEHPGAFTGTSLADFLHETGRKKVVLTGYMAHVCVSTTARQAEERGYEVVIVEDAVGDRDIPGVKAEELVRITLAELADAFGSVVKSESIN